MPTIEELQRFQFEDFALENTRRGKLTVLGEHAFGAEQGRIVTAPARTSAEGSGDSGEGGGGPREDKTGACCIDGTCSIMTAADCGSAGGTYQGDNSVCDPNPCGCADCGVSEISIQATMSGTLPGGSECEPADVDFDVFCETATATSTGGCVSDWGTEATQIEFTCPGECLLPDDPTNTLQVAVELVCGVDRELDDWTLRIHAPVDGNQFCGLAQNFGGDDIYEENIGPGIPSGEYILDFDDGEAPGVHYTVTINITP